MVVWKGTISTLKEKFKLIVISLLNIRQNV